MFGAYSVSPFAQFDAIEMRSMPGGMRTYTFIHSL